MRSLTRNYITLAWWVMLIALLAITLGALWQVDVRYRANMLVVPTPNLQSSTQAVIGGGTSEADLRAQVATQQVIIDQLGRELEAVKYEQRTTTLDTRWLLDSKLLWAGGLSALAALLGFTAYNSIEAKVRERIRAVLDRNMFGMDPTLIEICLVEWPANPKTEKDKDLKGDPAKLVETKVEARQRVARQMAQVANRLRISGLNRIESTGDIRYALSHQGVVVVLVATKADEVQFLDELTSRAEELDPWKTGIIIYAVDRYWINDQAFVNLYENIAMANTPTTLMSAVLAVGRGLNL